MAQPPPVSGSRARLPAFCRAFAMRTCSPAAVHEAKRAVLDWIGCALAGSAHPTVNVLLATFEELGSVPVATVLGRGGRKLSLLDAPVANGQMGHVLDFDDTHLGGVILHTSTATLPALFALGEWRKSSGRDVIVALAAAFEAGIRVGQAATSHHLGGWHLTGTLGTVAAAAGSARLIRLDEKQTTFALGIACTQAAGMQQNRGSDCKSLHAGKSAYHGVLASMLASKGFQQLAGDSRRKPGLHQDLQRDATERRDHRRPGPDMDDHRKWLQAVRLRCGPAPAHRRDDRRLTKDPSARFRRWARGSAGPSRRDPNHGDRHAELRLDVEVQRQPCRGGRVYRSGRWRRAVHQRALRRLGSAGATKVDSGEA